MNQQTKIFIDYFINVVYFCLGISSIVIGLIDKDDCDYTTLKFLNINHFLIIIGTGSVIFSIYYLMCNILVSYNKISGIPKSVILLVTMLHVLFIIFWYAIGFNIIFSSNMKCVLKKSFHVIYALVVWSLMAIFLAINQAIYNYRELTNKQYYTLLI